MTVVGYLVQLSLLILPEPILEGFFRSNIKYALTRTAVAFHTNLGVTGSHACKVGIRSAFASGSTRASTTALIILHGLCTCINKIGKSLPYGEISTLDINPYKSILYGISQVLHLYVKVQLLGLQIKHGLILLFINHISNRRLQIQCLIANLICGGIQSGMGYLGAPNLAALRKNARYIRVSGAGQRESNPHDIIEVKKSK